MNPRMPKNSGDIDEPKKGTVILYQEKYQLAPAVTKKAPDKNLQASFQNNCFFILILFYSQHQSGMAGFVMSG